MNSKLILLLATGGAALLFAADQPKKEPSELEKLKAKVALLEGRIDQLEARVQSLSRTARTSFEVPRFELNRDTSVPPNIGEIEVNGLKVYKIPLAQPADAVK
jgi:hypothetical protein